MNYDLGLDRVTTTIVRDTEQAHRLPPAAHRKGPLCYTLGNSSLAGSSLGHACCWSQRLQVPSGH